MSDGCGTFGGQPHQIIGSVVAEWKKVFEEKKRLECELESDVRSLKAEVAALRTELEKLSNAYYGIRPGVGTAYAMSGGTAINNTARQWFAEQWFKASETDQPPRTQEPGQSAPGSQR